MNIENLPLAVEINMLLRTTKKALSDLYNVINKPGSKDNVMLKDSATYDLFIGQHRDGSGASLMLNRYWGNMDLLLVIEKELERQIEVLNKKASEL